MKKLLLFAIAATCTYVSYSQYCSGGPTQTIDSNVESVVLTGETGSINYTGCPGLTGLEEQLGQVTYLNAGQQYTATIQFGTCGGDWAGAGEAWIDFNGDEIFDVTESIGTWSGTPPTSISNFTFTVPGGVTNGLTRMRVNQQEGGTNPLDPCADFTWGSSVDFGIYLQNGVDCSGYVGNDETDPRLVNSLPFLESYNSQVCYTNENIVYSAPDVFYLVLLDNVGAINISLCGSSFDTFLSVMKTNGEIIGVNDDFASCGTSSELSVITSGLDSVFVIVDGWGTQSGEYDIQISEVDLSVDKQNLDLFQIYPNPTTGVLTLENKPQNSTISVYNASSQIVISEATNNTMDLSNLDNGVYFVHLVHEGQRVIKKIIKK